MQEKVVIIGAGGHAKVIADIVIKSGNVLVGFLDDNISAKTEILHGYTVIGEIEDALKLHQEDQNLKFIIGIGNNFIRKKIAENYNLPYYTAIHPSAIIGIDVTILEGTIIMANTCINPKATIGKHCIINTGAIIEHDNEIQNFVHISPRVALGGTVIVEENTHVGIGATVKNNITISKNCIIGAGAVVVKNIVEEGMYVGVPAKKSK